MELALLVYGISLLTGISLILAMGCFLGAVGVFCMLTFASISASTAKEYSRPESDKYKRAEATIAKNDKIAKQLATFAIVCSVFLVLVPSEKTAWLMVGAYATQKIVTTPEMQATGNKVITIINNKLDEYIEKK
jgi:hypothetical protein